MCVLFERHPIHPNTIFGALQAIYAVVIDIISGFVFGFSKVAGAATREGSRDSNRREKVSRSLSMNDYLQK